MEKNSVSPRLDYCTIVEGLVLALSLAVTLTLTGLTCWMPDIPDWVRLTIVLLGLPFYFCVVMWVRCVLRRIRGC